MLSPQHSPSTITRATWFVVVLLLVGICSFMAFFHWGVDYLDPTNEHTAFYDSHFLQADHHHQHRRLNPSIGSFHLLVLLVYFPEHVSRPRPSREYFEHLCETEIMDYLHQQSYGLYHLLSCRVQPWIATNHSQELYAGSDSNLVGSEYASSFFVPVLTALDNDGHGLDWQTDFDTNHDGRLDAVLVLHSGYDAAYRGGGECGDPNYRDRIQSQGHANSSGHAWMSHNGSVRLQGYALASAYDWVCDPDRATTMGVPVHELMHTLGSSVPDLYDGSTGKLGGIASFDVMASALGPARTGRPASASSYTKQRLGWLNYTEIVHNGEYRLATVNRYAVNAALVIQQGFAVDEYLLLEFRQAIDYDSDLFGGGLLIYHVDDNKRLQGVGGYPGLEGWPENGLHYRVALLQADGQYDLERGVNNGDAGDFWKPGMMLGPGSSSIDNENGGGVVYPNTDSFQNGNIVPTGISIAVLEENGEYVTVRVTGIAADTEDGTTAVTLTPTGSPTRDTDFVLDATFAPITVMVPAPAPTDNRVSVLPTTPTDAVTSLPPISNRPTLSTTWSPPNYLTGISGSPMAAQQITMESSVAPSYLSLPSPSVQPSLSQSPSVSTYPSFAEEPIASLQLNDSAIVPPTTLLPTTSAPSPRIGKTATVSAFPIDTRNDWVDENSSSPSSNTPVRCCWTVTWITVGFALLIVP